MKIKLKEGLTNPKEKTAKGLADKINAWYDFNTDYIDDGGQRRRAERTNDNVVEWFGEHPFEIKKEAFKLIKSKASEWGANYVSRFERTFGKHIKEDINEDVNWGTISNIFVKFLKANTKELEKRVNANDLEGTKAAIKSIISGLTNAQKSLKLEGVTKSTSLNEVTVTRIPNFNLESDVYIIMLYLLKNNSGFKKAATNAGIDLFSGANVKSVFAGLHNNLKKVITPQIIKAVVETINQDRKKIFIDNADIQKGVHTARFAGLLALGVVDSFINDPIDYKLINDLGNAKLKGLADEFSIGRGKIKLGVMMGNKGF